MLSYTYVVFALTSRWPEWMQQEIGRWHLTCTCILLVNAEPSSVSIRAAWQMQVHIATRFAKQLKTIQKSTCFASRNVAIDFLCAFVVANFWPISKFLGSCQVGSGGGYPETFEDLHAALSWLGSPEAATLLPAALPVAVVGHSAGGHLATWLGLQEAAKEAMFPEVGVGKVWVFQICSILLFWF